METYASSPFLTIAGGYFHEDAVLAHENVHKSLYTAAFDLAYNSFRNYVETDMEFEIPIAIAADPAVAKAIITATPGYVGEIGTGIPLDVTNAFNIADVHSPSSLFVTPQEIAIAPYIALVSSRLSS